MSKLQPPTFDAPTSEWLVFADALQEANDPRGELISLNQAVAEGKPTDARDAYVAKHAQALLGVSPEKVAELRIGWRHCLIESVDVLVRSSQPVDLEAVITSPAAKEVRTIRLLGMTDNEQPVDLSSAMAKLAANLPPSCHSVAFIDERASRSKTLVSRDYDPDPNLVTLGTLSLFFALPTVKQVYLEVADATQLVLDIDAPHLESFTLRCLRYADSYGEGSVISGRLAEAKWPKLQELELRLAESWLAGVPEENDPYVAVYSDEELEEADEGDNDGTNWSELEPLLTNVKKVPLRRLALNSADSAASLLTAIANVGLAPTLKELDLSDCSIHDVAWFESNKDMLEKLDRLVLERTPLTADDAGTLSKIGPKVVWSTGSGATYRYLVGME